MPISILMPALSPTMTEGRLAKWLIKEGENVSSGMVIAEIETDKATMEVEAVDEGKLVKILVAEGTDGVAVNALIGVLLEEDEDASTVDDFIKSHSSGGSSTAAETPVAEAPASPSPETVKAEPADAEPIAAENGKRVFSSPLARRIARDNNIDIASLKGSGPHGRIIKHDVEMAISNPVAQSVQLPVAATSSPAPSGIIEPPYTVEQPSTMRKIIAARLTESKTTIPHFYLSADCQLDELLALRGQLNTQGGGQFKLSVNDLIIKAAARALKQVPDANVRWAEDGVHRYTQSDISVAVAIQGGLITPVIKNADSKGLEAISNEMKDLALRAREGKLVPEDYQGGSFSISNLGMFGVKSFSAVINPPQACILAVGAGTQQPIVKDGALAIGTIMSVTLSVDHRAVDGSVGAQLLSAFKGYIEAPLTLLL